MKRLLPVVYAAFAAMLAGFHVASAGGAERAAAAGRPA